MMDKIMEYIKKMLKSRKLKYGTNAFILIAAVVAIAVLVNVLVGMTDLKLDLTPNKLYSISDATKDILKNLNKDVVIIGLFDEEKADEDYKEVKELLDHYQKYPRIKVEYVDLDKNPGIKKELDPDNTKDLKEKDFIVKSGNRSKKLEYYDLFSTQFDQQTFQEYKVGTMAEQGFTGAIKYVTADRTPVVYFTEGHEEYKTDSSFESVKTYLDRNNYDVKEINLVTQEKVPEDAELLVVAAPKKDFSADEKTKISEYLKSGGKAIFMFDSLSSDPQFNQVDALLSEYNLSLNYDRVKENDQNRYVPGTPTAVLLDVKKHEIFQEDFNLLLADSRSINILKNQKDYLVITPLLTTSDKAVGEQIDKSRGADIKGPLDVAVAVQYKEGYQPTKILVMGNGYFITDEAQQKYGASHFSNSMYFFLSTMNWMMESKDEPIVPAKMYDEPRVDINALQSRIMGLLVVIVLPLIILAAGLYMFLRRRHL